MKKILKQHLMANPSYLKWGKQRLAKQFGVGPKTIANVLNSLEKVKEEYLRNL